MSGNVTAVDSFIAEIEKLIKEENWKAQNKYTTVMKQLYWKTLPEKNFSCGTQDLCSRTDKNERSIYCSNLFQHNGFPQA